MNEYAMARVGPQRHRKKTALLSLADQAPPLETNITYPEPTQEIIRLPI